MKADMLRDLQFVFNHVLVKRAYARRNHWRRGAGRRRRIQVCIDQYLFPGQVHHQHVLAVITLRVRVVPEFVTHVFDIKNFHHPFVIGNHVSNISS